MVDLSVNLHADDDSQDKATRRKRSAEETRQHKNLKQQRHRESLSSSERDSIQATNSSARQLAREQRSAAADAPSAAGLCRTWCLMLRMKHLVVELSSLSLLKRVSAGVHSTVPFQIVFLLQLIT